MSSAQLYRYIHVNADGSARELHPDERVYLETEFRGGDGAAPYIKSDYQTRNGWGDLAGYLERALLPPGTPVKSAPAENPNRPQGREEHIAWLRSKGADVVENSDGSFSVRSLRR